MLDPPTQNGPFADKREKVGIDGVPKYKIIQTKVDIVKHKHYTPHIIEKACFQSFM